MKKTLPSSERGHPTAAGLAARDTAASARPTQSIQPQQGWNDTYVASPDHACIHQLFEDQAARTPEAIAQIDGDRFLTYQELNQRANRLAHHLQALGVEPEVLVGLYLERSLATVVGILGILKAGGGYVPLDHTHPPERLRSILDQVQPPVVLTQRRLRSRLPENAAVILEVDRPRSWSPSARCPSSSNPACRATSESTAYVIFTSGSTGQPKGVIGLHKGFVNRMRWIWREFPFAAHELCCQRASLSFIDSIGELLVPLLHGVPTLILPEEAARDPLPLVELLERHGVTRITMVATLLRMILTTIEDLGARLPRLRHWFSSGEALAYDLERLFFSRCDADLSNLYGPSEASIEVTFWRCRRDNASGVVAIGQPIDNTQIHLLDAALQPVPVGVVGELYIAGVSLARGYHQRGGLTAELFLPNPFSTNAGERMYRSGDLARFTVDGILEVRGRADRQVKVRGYRVELDEVEVALQEHPDLLEVAVVARVGSTGALRLCAYGVPTTSPANPPEPSQLRAFLAERLPSFMVPAHIVLLDSLPRTTSGKLNRRALPAPGPMEVAVATSSKARTQHEATVAAIFAEVLGVATVATDASFFELGGDSLLATLVLSRIRDRFSIALPLRSLFTEPTVAGWVARHLGSATPRQLHEPGVEEQIEPLDNLRPSRRTGDSRLSATQERMWFLCHMDSGPAYTTPIAIRLDGHLELATLAGAIQDIARRHESLRTVFPAEAGTAVQRVQDFTPIRLPLADLSNLPTAKREASLRTIVREQARAPFDLALGPLLRVSLARLNSHTHTLVLSLHHIIFDGWSWTIFQRELVAFYEARIARRPATLGELRYRYRDYAEWQHGWLRSAAARRQLEAWKRRLKGAPALLELPLDRPRPPVQSFQGSSLHFSLAGADSGQLRQLCQQSGASRYMVLLAAYAALIARYSSQHDQCIGTPIANRNRTAVEPLIGLFVNTLVLRMQLDDEKSFLSLVRQVREVSLEAFEHQDLPFETLVRELSPRRNLSYSPIFQLMFALDNAERPFDLGGVRARPIAIESDTTTCDLSLTLNPDETGMRGVFEYSRALFDRVTLERLASHYQNLLSAALAAPATPLADLALLSVAQRRHLEVDCNRSSAQYGPFRFVDQLFEAQAVRQPKATAVVHQQEQLSFGELNAQSNRLARRLRAHGVGPERLVGICLEHSVERITAVLAVHKAGGAYLPLDPDYPDDRLAFMLRDSQAPVLLTRRHLADRLRGHHAEVVCLDEPNDTAETDDSNLDSTARDRDDLAYVIYTSGSTGTPKGVMITHRSLTNALHAWDDTYGLSGRCSCHLQMASFSFDVFTGDVVRSLCTGARLVLTSRDTLLSPAALHDLMLQQKVDVADFAPPLLRNLERYLNSTGKNLNFLRLMVVGTDAWNMTEFHRWRALCGTETRFLNAYGVTEATVASSYFENPHSDRLSGGLVPIGRPLPNVQLYILDRRQRSTPIGVTGELYIGGTGVGRGYLHRPELTRERFVDDPFANRPGARLYRTGDLVRRRVDGNIELLGRSDHQVKIRGFRVELGEIECVLTRHPRVRESTVLARADDTGNRRLWAYLVLRAEATAAATATATATVTAAQLRGFLTERLPDYMVPTSFVQIEAFPLTPNGKIDRRALQQMGTSLANRTGPRATARTPQEEMLATLWSEVLDLPRVGIDDNFFDLGGHSLLAMRLVSRIDEAFSMQLPVSAVFKSSTIAELAGVIQELRGKAPPAVREPLSALASSGDAALSFAQQRLWFQSQLSGANTSYNMLTQWQLEGCLEHGALEQSLLAIVARHSILRTFFPSVNGSPVQRVREVPQHIVRRIDLGSIAPSARQRMVGQLATLEAHRPFNLESGPLLRATLVTEAPESHRLLLTLHHIVSDAWSMTLLARELGRNYQALLEGGSSPLPALSVQYRDFSVWQHRVLTPQALEPLLTYWRQQLAGAPALLELPSDRPRPPEQHHRGQTHWCSFDSELTGALRSTSARAGSSLYMTLLAALATLLSRYSSQLDLCIGSPIANRAGGEIEGLIGFFVNTLVMRVNLEGNPRFSELLHRVRAMALAAYDHQELPFERLVEALRPERNPSFAPLFQVMFVLQNAPAEALELSGLSVQQLKIPNSTAKFDLLVSIEETAGHLVVEFEYNSDLFDADRIRRMAGHYQNLLRGLVAHGERQVEHLPLLSEPEQHQLLVEWNTQPTESLELGCLHHAFEAQVKLTPERVAVEIEIAAGESAELGRTVERLTYHQLNNQANALSDRLRSLGVGLDVVVGLCVARSVSMIVGLLAVLKTGGAYLPLDPAYPLDRLQFMLEDSGARLLISERQAALVASASIPTQCVEDFPFRERSLPNPVSAVTPDHLIYITYTSGSTGKPKGIAMSHRAVGNLIAWHLTHEHPATGAASSPPVATTLQFAPLSFDVSFQEIFSTWCAGGTLVLISEQDRRDPAELLKLIRRRSVRRLFLPTAALQPLATMASALEVPTELDEVWVAGEQLLISEEIRDWFSTMPGCPLINFYGPSETHAVTALVLDHDPRTWSALPAIGQPIANSRIYLLDQHQQPVPRGVPGEIYIGGPVVARGYLTRPQLTEERFTVDPFSTATDGRMYRSGDQARYLPDGSLEFLGRLDNQVKIRGFRIEIGEVETALGSHPDVNTAIVTLRQSADGGKSLAAYLTAFQGRRLDLDRIERHLTASLPEYMVPASFTVLDQFPLSAAGKIDHSALPEPEHRPSPVLTAAASPRDDLEATLVRIWEETLGTTPIGIHDNFFDLGGHSLLAMSLIGRMQKALGSPLPVELLFTGPTIAQVASHLRHHSGSVPWSCLVGLQTTGSRPPFFCVHPGGGSVFCYLELMRHLGAEQPFYAFQSPGLDPEQRPLTRIDEMARTYIRALRKVQPRGPYQLGGWSLGGLIAFEMARQLTAAGQRVHPVLLIDSPAPHASSAPDLREESFLIAMARDLGGMFGEQIDLSPQTLFELSPGQRLEAVLASAQRADLLPPDITSTTLRRLVEVFQNNLEAYFTYRPRPYAGKVVLITAHDPGEPGKPETEAVISSWRSLLSDGLEAHRMAGDHYTILRPPGVERLAALLGEHLASHSGSH